MDDQLWYDFYTFGVQYAREAKRDADSLHPDAIRRAVREQIAGQVLVEGSFDTQELHAAFALGVQDTLNAQSSS